MSKIHKRVLASMRAKARERDFAEWCPDDLKFLAMTDEQFLRYLATRGLLHQPAVADTHSSDDPDFTEQDDHGDVYEAPDLLQLNLFDYPDDEQKG